MLIPSVTGMIDTAELGTTLMHEHLANLDFHMCNAFSDWLDRETVIEQFAEEVKRGKQHGLKTMLECTTINLGRDIHLLKDAAERADIQLLVSTGLYHQEDPWIAYEAEADYIAEFYLRDIYEGIQDTDIKPAVIKCATDAVWGMSDINRILLQAAAIASKESGTPVYTHSSSKQKSGLYQQELFIREQGILPHKIVIGHAFDWCDYDYIEKLIQGGTYVGCDRVGLRFETPTEDLANCVAHFCKKGYADRIMLSHDSCIASDYALSFTRTRRDRSVNPCTGFYYEVFEGLIPRLRKLGVTEEQIHTMLVDNPRRYFEGIPF